MWRRSLGILVAGLGIGILSGLSASPVIGAVITTIVAAACGVTAALAGLSQSDGETQPPTPRRRVNSIPVMLLIIGVVVGAVGGVKVRTWNWLGTSPNQEVQKWQKTGLSETELYRRIFDHEYPPASASPKLSLEVAEKGESPAQDATKGVLLSDAAAALIADCKNLKQSTPQDIQKRLLFSGDRKLTHYAASLKDPASLSSFVGDYLCFDK